jgi:hypothetical protein
MGWRFSLQPEMDRAAYRDLMVTIVYSRFILRVKDGRRLILAVTVMPGAFFPWV